MNYFTTYKNETQYISILFSSTLYNNINLHFYSGVRLDTKRTNECNDFTMICVNFNLIFFV